MNKIILGCLTALAVLTLIEQWTEASFVDDFVHFPSLKMKRDLEMGEFLIDGNMHAARKRANTRQRRSNDESTPDTIKRHRRSLMEDEDEDFHCSAYETSNMKRSVGRAKRNMDEPITYSFDDDLACSETTRQRFIEMMIYIDWSTQCTFDVTEQVAEHAASAYAHFTCESIGNFAPIGGSGRVNVQEKSQKAGYVTIHHELLHLCGLDHEQKDPCAGESIIINYECIDPAFWSQYEVTSTVDCETGKRISFTSVMMYRANAFQINTPECSAQGTIISKHPTSQSTNVFAAHKELNLQEIKKLLAINGRDCNNDLFAGESDGKDCSILQFDPEAIEHHARYMSADTSYISTVTAGKIEEIGCMGQQLEIEHMEWSGIPGRGRCWTTGAMRVFAAYAAIDFQDFQPVAYVCDFDVKTDPTPYVFMEDVLVYVDGSQVDSGILSVHFTCHKYRS